MSPHPFANVRAIIYDLDGTLYEETHHFDRYATLLAQALPPDRREAFLADYAAVRDGQHVLRVGTFYDPRRDWVLRVVGGQVLAAHTWDGQPVPPDAVRAAYPDPVVPDQVHIVSVGDLWWAPVAVAAHYGLPLPYDRRPFLALREWMSGPEFQIRPIPGLADTMAALRRRGVVQVLATNSPQPDSEALLRKAGLLDLLDGLFFQCRKPQGFPQVVAGVEERWGVPAHQVLSVGDNYTNDIAPARALGCRTAHVDPFGSAAGLPCDVRVPRMADLLPYLAQAGTAWQADVTGRGGM